MKKKLIILSGVVMGFTPLVALAQISTSGSSSANCEYSAASGGTILGLLCRFGQILNSVVPVLIALGVVFFVYGVITYVVASDEEAKSTGRDRIIFGIVGLAVIIGVWGLVAILRNTFDLRNQGNLQLPTVPVVIPGQGGNNNPFGN